MTKEQYQKCKEKDLTICVFYDKVQKNFGNEKLSDMLTNMYIECKSRLDSLEDISDVKIELTIL